MYLFSKMCMVLGISEDFVKNCAGVFVEWESFLTINSVFLHSVPSWSPFMANPLANKKMKFQNLYEKCH